MSTHRQTFWYALRLMACAAAAALLPGINAGAVASGGSGTVYSTHKIFAPGMTITQVNPSSPGSPTGEDVTKAIDGSTSTKYLNFTKLNTGFTVNTATSSIARTISITTANDFPERDPISYTLEGSNDGSIWSSITSGSLTCSATRFATQSFGFSNAIAYSYYRVVFPSVCNTSTATAMQVSEVQLYQADEAYNTSSGLYYTKIQDAIDAAASGNTIRVAAGTYAENVTINKSLTILGPNDNTSGCAARVAEAVVVPSGTASVPSGATAVETGEIFHVAASNVIIKGFTFDGDNTSITSGVTNTTGADMDAAEGVTVYEDNINNLTVSNNIFRNLSYTGVTIFGGSYSAPPTSGHTVSDNKMENLGTYNDPSTNTTFNINRWGVGVLLYNAQYANISNNCMNNVRTGVQTGNFHQANPGTATYQSIAGNTMTNVRRSGVFHNLLNALASGYTISGNSITGTSNANETKWDGIELFSLNTPCTVTNNTINATSVTQTSYGYDVWNVASANPSAISGGTVTGTSIGVFANNYDGYGSDATDGAYATLSAISITPNAGGTGIRVYDNPSSTHAGVQLSVGAGVVVNNGTNGLVIENAAASVSSLGNVAFSGQSGSYIKLVNNANNLNATAASFGGVMAGNSLTPAQAFPIEDKIVHKIDNSALGFVSVKANNDYVTTNSYVSPNTAADIQRGIDAASAGYTVNVAAGTYTNNLNVNKTLSLKGAQAGVCAPSRSSGSESIINGSGGMIVSANNAIIDGFTIQDQTTTDYGHGNGFAIFPAPPVSGIQVLNNIIKNNIVGLALVNSGTNPTQALINCNWFDANNQSGNASGQGIYTDQYVSQGITSNVTISNNKFSGHNAFGIDFSVDDQTKATKNITMSTNTFTGNDRAMFLYNINNSSFTGNTVTNSAYATSGDLRVYGGVNNLSVTNNFFGPSAPHAIRITDDGAGATSSNFTVHSNNFSGYSASNVALDVASGYTGGALNATCNWFGSTVPATVAAQVSGSVTYIPYLNSGTDADANAANGFQPAASCSGSCGTLTLSSAVTPLYPMAGQKIQTIFLNYPSSAQTETINVSANGGTAPFAYTWTVSGYNTAFFTDPGTNSYTFAPTSANVPVGSNADNLYTFNITANDAQGCTIAPTSKRINVVNPYTTVNGVTKIVVCHKVYNRNVYTTQLLVLDSAQVPAHLAHGDPLGNCAAFTGRETAPAVITSTQQEEEQTIVAYPNPTTGAFTLELSAIRERADIIVTDMQGKVLMTRTLGVNDGLKTVFNLNGYAAGMYFIQVKDGETAYRSRIILH